MIPPESALFKRLTLGSTSWSISLQLHLFIGWSNHWWETQTCEKRDHKAVYNWKREIISCHWDYFNPNLRSKHFPNVLTQTNFSLALISTESTPCLCMLRIEILISHLDLLCVFFQNVATLMPKTRTARDVGPECSCPPGILHRLPKHVNKLRRH